MCGYRRDAETRVGTILYHPVNTQTRGTVWRRDPDLLIQFYCCSENLIELLFFPAFWGELNYVALHSVLKDQEGNGLILKRAA